MSNSTSIVFVTKCDLSGTSGGGVATKEIVAALARHTRIDLTVICPKPEGRFPSVIDRNSIQMHHFWTTSQGTPAERIRAQISLLRRLRSVLRREQPDAVVTRHGATMVVPALVATRYGIEHILLVRGRAYNKLQYPWLLKRIFQMNVRLSNDVYVAFEEIKADAKAARSPSQSSPIVFRNAVDPRRFIPQSKTSSRSQRDDIPNSVPDADLVVGFVGSLRNRHRIQELLEAADLVTGEVSLSILIVGSGPNELKLKSKAEEIAADVHFTGFVDHDTVPSYIAVCDLMYGIVDPDSPSNPIKCYEYLACERPIITSDVTEFEFVEQIDAGFLIDRPTPEAIADRLNQASTYQSSRLSDMGKRGREHVIENHTWDRLPKLLLDNME